MRKLGLKLLTLFGAASLALTATVPVEASTETTFSPMDQVLAAYDPFTVKEFSLDLLPLPEFSDSEEGVQAAWDRIRTDTTNSLLVKGIFTAGDDPTPYLVEVRRKSSRALPSESNPQKVGLKIGFLEPKTWNGVTKLSLENGGDISPIAEGLAWNLHQLAKGEDFYAEGYEPGVASWINLTVNGQNLGVYTSVEQRNKQFLKNRAIWSETGTWLYEGDDIGNPVLEQGPLPGSPTTETLCFFPFRPAASACPTPTDEELATILPTQIDMDALLTQAAVDAYTANNDALVSKGKNYHFVDRTGQPRKYFPWDLDAVIGKGGASNIYATTVANRKGKLSYNQSGYQTLILNHPDFRRAYNTKVSSLFGSNGILSSSQIAAFLNQVESATTPFLTADPYVSAVIGSSPSAHFTSLRQWIAERNLEVLSQVQQNAPAPRADYPSGDSPAATSLAASSSFTGKAGSTITLGFRLTSSSEGVPNEKLTLVFNKVSYSATTDNTGLATFTVKLPSKSGSYEAIASFSGSSDYLASGVSAPVTVTR